MIIIVGLVYAVIYYFVFSFLIKKLDFKTPGREDDDVDFFKEAQAAAARNRQQSLPAPANLQPMTAGLVLYSCYAFGYLVGIGF